MVAKLESKLKAALWGERAHNRVLLQVLVLALVLVLVFVLFLV